MTNSNFSANNFSSIDAEFALNIDNNNNSKTTMNTNTSNSISSDNDIDNEFDLNSDIKVIFTKTFSVYGATGSDVSPTLTIRFNDKTNEISWGGKTYRLAPKLISVTKGEPVAAYDTSNLSDRDELLDIICDSVKAQSIKGKAQALLSALIGTVVLGDYELSNDNAHASSYNCAAIKTAEGNLVDAQQVLREDVVRAFWTSPKTTNDNGVILTKKLRGNSGAWTEGCLQMASETWGFAMPDKNNSKCAYVHNSIGVMGLSADGMQSIVKADKAGKFFSRHSMVKHISAEVEEPTFDGLVSQMSDGKFAVHNGILLNATYVKHPLISLVAGDGGIISRKEITGISNKRIRGSFNLDLLVNDGCEDGAEVREAIADLKGKAKFHKVISMIDAEIKANTEGMVKVFEPGDFITFAGQVIFRNEHNTPVEISSVHVTIGEVINTAIGTLNIDCKCKVTDTSYNHKLRGQWLKGMSFRNDNLAISINGNVDNSDIIINDNCVKNVEGIYLRMFANSTGQVISWCKDGQLRKGDFVSNSELVLGEVFNEAELQTWLGKFSRTASISLVIDRAELAEFKAVKPAVFTGVKEVALDNGRVQLAFEAKVLSAPLVCAIELSSVAENFCPGRKVSPISSNYLSTFNTLLSSGHKMREGASRPLGKHATRIAKTIELCASKEPDASFNLLMPAQLNALQAVLTKANKTHNARDMFMSLADRYPKGIELRGGVVVSADKQLRPWTVFIPTHLIKVVGGFDVRNGSAFDDNIKNTYALLLMILNLSSKLDAYHKVADYAMKLGAGLAAWKEETVRTSKSLTKGTSAFINHGMKVISNPEVGYIVVDGISIPNVVLDESNPCMVANPDNAKLSMAIGRNGKYLPLVREGDIMFVHRNPVIDLTPVVVVKGKAQTICGKYVVAMAPSALVWSSHSDVDGDVLWLIPGKQIGFNSLELAGIAMSHPLVGKDIAEATMAAFGAGSLVAGILGKEGKEFALNTSGVVTERLIVDSGNPESYVGCLNDEGKQISSYEEFAVVRWERLVEQAEATAKHYSMNTGLGYQTMFNAYSKFVSDALGGNINQQRRVLVGVKASSFVVYEEWSLGGFTGSNEHFDKLGEQAKAKLNGINPTTTATNNKFLRRREAITANSKVAYNLVVDYVAMAKIQSRIEHSNKPSQEDKEYAIVNLAMAKQSYLYSDAVRFGLFRTLSKGAFSFGSTSRINPIFAKQYSTDDNNPYQPVISAWRKYVSAM